LLTLRVFIVDFSPLKMAKRLTVVVSQGQSANPAKRKLEEDIVGRLLFQQGVEVTVIPNLYDLAPDGTGMLCLQGITGDLVLCSWLFPRAAHWILERNGIHGQIGTTLLKAEGDEEDDDEDTDARGGSGKETNGDGDSTTDEKPRVGLRHETGRTIYCLDLRTCDAAQPYLDEIARIQRESSVQTVSLMSWINGAPKPEQLERYLDDGSSFQFPGSRLEGSGFRVQGSGPTVEATNSEPETSTSANSAEPDLAQSVNRIDEQPARRWYPVIDYTRCTNCMECLDFCLFGVYGVDKLDTILIEQPDNCRKGCPACSRVCPENAIIFPQHKTPAIAGSDERAGVLKIDLSKLFGGGEGADALTVAVLERDEQLLMVGRDAVGMAVGVPKRQTGKASGPKDELDSLMDQLDALDL
jgi:NAD-dependent dihydropyrimidine dehydrogenase PreA subunit